MWMRENFSSADIKNLCNEVANNSVIDQKLYEKFHVKRGLRRSDGTGVIAGITNICNVHGYIVNEGEVEAIPGELIYLPRTPCLARSILGKRSARPTK